MCSSYVCSLATITCVSVRHEYPNKNNFSLNIVLTTQPATLCIYTLSAIHEYVHSSIMLNYTQTPFSP